VVEIPCVGVRHRLQVHVTAVLLCKTLVFGAAMVQGALPG